MTRRRTPPPASAPVDVSKFNKGRKVWIWVGGTEHGQIHRRQKVPGVVKRVDQSSVAVLVIHGLHKENTMLTVHITEAWRILDRVREPHQQTDPTNMPIDQAFDQAAII